MIPAGEVANDWLIIGGGLKAFTDPQYADDPFISFANNLMVEGGEDPTVGLLGTGFNFAWPMVEALRIAAGLDGGLNRTNFMLAQRAMDITNPMLLDGISFSLDGNEDAYFIEGSEISRYDSAAESWIQEGDVVDLNGSSPPCNWTDTGS